LLWNGGERTRNSREPDPNADANSDGYADAHGYAPTDADAKSGD
jgi:hypothetical protein